MLVVLCINILAVYCLEYDKMLSRFDAAALDVFAISFFNIFILQLFSFVSFRLFHCMHPSTNPPYLLVSSFISSIYNSRSLRISFGDVVRNIQHKHIHTRTYTNALPLVLLRIDSSVSD